MPSLPARFFARPAETVARELLGQTLVRRLDGRLVRARVVETEAYVGVHDLACHAAKGRTERTEVMFGPAGRLYVYFVYGMHHMLNVVTGRRGDGEAVLLRAAEPLGAVEGSLTGPGRLAKTLRLTREHSGLSALGRGELFFEPGPPPRAIGRSPRIGVDYAGDWRLAELRFFDAESEATSGPRRRDGRGAPK